MRNNLDLEILDFSDIQQLEESIAPVLIAPSVGGSCSGGKGSGCTCVVPS